MIPLLWKDSHFSQLHLNTHPCPPTLSLHTLCFVIRHFSYSIFHTAVLHHLADIQCPENSCSILIAQGVTVVTFCSEHLCGTVSAICATKTLHRLKLFDPEGHQWQKGHQSMFYCFPHFIITSEHRQGSGTDSGRMVLRLLLSQAFLKFGVTAPPHYSTIHLGAGHSSSVVMREQWEESWHEAGKQRHSGKAAWAQNICFWAGTELAEAWNQPFSFLFQHLNIFLLIFLYPGEAEKSAYHQSEGRVEKGTWRHHTQEPTAAWKEKQCVHRSQGGKASSVCTDRCTNSWNSYNMRGC